MLRRARVLAGCSMSSLSTPTMILQVTPIVMLAPPLPSTSRSSGAGGADTVPEEMLQPDLGIVEDTRIAEAIIQQGRIAIAQAADAEAVRWRLVQPRAACRIKRSRSSVQSERTTSLRQISGSIGQGDMQPNRIRKRTPSSPWSDGKVLEGFSGLQTLDDPCRLATIPPAAQHGSICHSGRLNSTSIDKQNWTAAFEKTDGRPGRPSCALGQAISLSSQISSDSRFLCASL